MSATSVMVEHPTPTNSVSDHYDRLDRFYRRLWGEHVHHGLWTESSFTAEEAVRHLVRQVARDARLTEGDAVCDVGCGYGAPARLWAREYGAHVTGFTVSQEQYAYARKHASDGSEIQYRLRDFLDNDRSDNAFDAVIAIESLTHIRDPAHVFEEAFRLLRPGGRFVACVWMAAPTPSRWQQKYLLEPIIEEGRLSGLPTAANLRRWAPRAGLSVEQIDDMTPLVRRTWTVVIRRFLRALVTDSDLRQVLFDPSASERVFARTIPRIWLAQHLGVLRYGWLVAKREQD